MNLQYVSVFKFLISSSDDDTALQQDCRIITFHPLRLDKLHLCFKHEQLYDA